MPIIRRLFFRLLGGFRPANGTLVVHQSFAPSREQAWQRALGLRVGSVVWVGLEAAAEGTESSNVSGGPRQAVALVFEGVGPDPAPAQLDAVSALSRPEFGAAGMGSGRAVFDPRARRFTAWTSDEFPAMTAGQQEQKRKDIMNETYTSRMPGDPGAGDALLRMAGEAPPPATPAPLTAQQVAGLEAARKRLAALAEANAAHEKKVEVFSARVGPLAQSIQSLFAAVDPDDAIAVHGIVLDETRLRIVQTFLGSVSGRRAGLRRDLDAAMEELQRLFRELGAFEMTQPCWNQNEGFGRVAMAAAAIDKLLSA